VRVILRAALATALVLVLAAAPCCTIDPVERQPPPHLYGVADPQFLRTMGDLVGPGIVGGNQVDALQNGDEIFPAMLAAIAQARRSVCFMTYIYWSDQIGHRFAEALSERARAGVKVHVLVDWFGSGKMDEDDIARMQEAGVEFRKFNPLRWYNVHRLNHRLHRKILVVDGRVGFTGGVGIAAQWEGDAQDSAHWRDSHFRVEGPVVAQMQAVFLENWANTTGRTLHGDDYFPVIEPCGDAPAQVFSSSPASGSTSMRTMYLLAIAAAERSIYLASAYFVPDDVSTATLLEALQRGVAVHILTPGPCMDAETVRRASRATWGVLLAGGARMLEYQPTMFHCKVLVVDERFVSVGSTNFDPRSFQLNDETNLNVYDERLAREAIAVFERDAAHSLPITYDAWRTRSWWEKFTDWSASLIEDLL
jgi:cardiolipin synthase